MSEMFEGGFVETSDDSVSLSTRTESEAKKKVDPEPFSLYHAQSNDRQMWRDTVIAAINGVCATRYGFSSDFDSLRQTRTLAKIAKIADDAVLLYQQRLKHPSQR